MATTVTPEDVKEIFASSLSDKVITMYINTTYKAVGECLDSNYDEDTATLIFTNMIAYLLSIAEGVQEVTSTKAPNGASITYNSGVTESGINQNPYGKIVRSFDIKGCWRALVPRTAFIGSVGPTANSLCSRNNLNNR